MTLTDKLRRDQGGAGVTPKMRTELTPTQKQAAYLLASGESIRDVAKQVKVSEVSMYKWKRRDDFAALVSKYCDQLIIDLKPRVLRQLNSQLDDTGWLGADASKTILQHDAKIHGSADSRIVVSFAGQIETPGVPDTGDVDDVDTGQTDE